LATRSPETLYAGPELRLAAQRSSVPGAVHGTLRGAANAAATLAGIAARRLRRRDKHGFEWLTVRGEEPATGMALTAAYAGNGTNRAWCLNSVLPGCEVVERLGAVPEGEVRRLRDHTDIDVFFGDGLPSALLRRLPAALIVMPAWIKQRVRVLRDWEAQVDGLRRETRQETGRILRKYRYRCELAALPAEFEHFYDSLYRPYIVQRFGASALVVDRDSFLRECGRGVLLRLFREGALLGAALLRPLGMTMAVVWSALDPARAVAETRGATDALDYFSLLYAHRAGCRWLDLGPSRPDLCDGVLRYKAKWGGEIHPGLAPQPAIHLSCRSDRESVRGFLGRHVFLARAGRALQAVLPVDGECDVEALATRLEALRTPGIRGYRVLAWTPPGSALRKASLGGDVTLVDAGGDQGFRTRG
jgi:hypothetical protein